MQVGLMDGTLDRFQRSFGGIAMSANITGWSPDIERGFKEILFRFLEEIQCTRAALYLYGPDDRFLLATQYGFGRRDVLAIEHGLQDPMVQKVRDLKGVPAAFNEKQNLGPLTDLSLIHISEPTRPTT